MDENKKMDDFEYLKEYRKIELETAEKIAEASKVLDQWYYTISNLEDRICDLKRNAPIDIKDIERLIEDVKWLRSKLSDASDTMNHVTNNVVFNKVLENKNISFYKEV